MTTREKLYRLIDELLDRDLPTAERVLEALRDTAEAVREWNMDEAPEDDEPETPEEAAAVQAAKDRIAAGERLVPHDEARRLLLEEP